jgi:hypothetical protein
MRLPSPSLRPLRLRLRPPPRRRKLLPRERNVVLRTRSALILLSPVVDVVKVVVVAADVAADVVEDLVKVVTDLRMVDLVPLAGSLTDAVVPVPKAIVPRRGRELAATTGVTRVRMSLRLIPKSLLPPSTRPPPPPRRPRPPLKRRRKTTPSPTRRC